MAIIIFILMSLLPIIDVGYLAAFGISIRNNLLEIILVLDNLHNGEIILLHGNSKDNANALDGIIKNAKNEGYEFKSLDEFER